MLEAFLPDLTKQAIAKIPDWILNRQVRKFFGIKAKKKDSLVVALDPYEHPIPRAALKKGQTRFIKKVGGQNLAIIGEDKVLGLCSIRVTNYTAFFFGYNKRIKDPVSFEIDDDLINRWESSIICFGSADSNSKTHEIENLPTNNLYKHVYDNNGFRAFEINGRVYSVSNKDLGIIFRINNPFSPGSKLFICAGIGEWGSSGSAYFLFNNWKYFYSKYGCDRNFVALVEVIPQSDSSATLVTEHSN